MIFWVITAGAAAVSSVIARVPMFWKSIASSLLMLAHHLLHSLNGQVRSNTFYLIKKLLR